MQIEFQLAGSIHRLGVVQRLPLAAIPKQHGAAAVFTLGNHSLERSVIDRVILDLDRQPLIAGIEARSFGDGPTFEHVAQLQPEVVMEVRGGVFLNDKRPPCRHFDLAAGLGRLVEVAFASIFGQRHVGIAFERRAKH